MENRRKGSGQALDLPVSNTHHLPMLSIAYTRVSTRRQVNEGDGLAIQLRKILDWSAANGLPDPEIFSDKGISGTTVEARDEFKAALTLALDTANAGKPVTFIVASLDRLGRDDIESLVVKKLMEAAGVRLVAINDGIDARPGDANLGTDMNYAIRTLINKEEKKTILARLASGRRSRRERNVVYAAVPKYGLQEGAKVGKDIPLEPAASELAAMERIKQLHAMGLSYRQIAAAMTAEGVPARCGRPWQPAVIGRIIHGRRVAHPKPAPVNPQIGLMRKMLLDGDFSA